MASVHRQFGISAALYEYIPGRKIRWSQPGPSCCLKNAQQINLWVQTQFSYFVNPFVLPLQ